LWDGVGHAFAIARALACGFGELWLWLSLRCGTRAALEDGSGWFWSSKAIEYFSMRIWR
jgi:hypothetical protein